jgi:hypothetical protein
MRSLAKHTLAGTALAVAAAVLCVGCGDSDSAKGSPDTGRPAKEQAPAKPAEALPEIPPVKSLEPTAPEPAPEPTKTPPPSTEPPPTTPPPAPAPSGDKPLSGTGTGSETDKPIGSDETTYRCDSCGKDATAMRSDPAPTCCGTAMKARP